MKHAITRKNHYVPQFYLENFKRDGWLHCFDEQGNKSLQLRDLSNKAMQRDLYSLKSKITEIEERQFIDIHLPFPGKKEALPEEKSTVHAVIQFMNDSMSNLVNAQGLFGALLPSLIDSKGISSTPELLASHYENRAKPIIEKLVHDDAPEMPEMSLAMSLPIFHFLMADTQLAIHENLFIHIKAKYKNNSEVQSLAQEAIQRLRHSFHEMGLIKNEQARNYVYLARYLIFQITRTLVHYNTYRDKMVTLVDDKDDIIKKFWLINLFSSLYAYVDNLAISNCKFVLVKNVSSTPFITSDHPVVDMSIMGTDGKGAELIQYALTLSPYRALLLSNNSAYKDLSRIDFVEAQVSEINKKIKATKHYYLFSNEPLSVAS